MEIRRRGREGGEKERGMKKGGPNESEGRGKEMGGRRNAKFPQVVNGKVMASLVY